jgi:hypothetical protein
VLLGIDEPRMEIYEEGDLGTALARFEELRPQERRLENAASRLTERFWNKFAASDSDAASVMLADDICVDDRRPLVNSGLRWGRNPVIEDLHVSAGFGLHISSSVIANRGERLTLTRACYTGRDERPEAFVIETLHVIGTDVEERISALITFEVDDVDAAFAELDARYLAGEAVAHARTWSVVANCFATLSRHEMPGTTPELVNIDHRKGAAFAPGELVPYLHAGWQLNRSTRTYVEAVHRLSDLGAVVTHAADLTSREGFDGEWRTIDILTVEGDLIDRVEVFDEANLDVALDRFDELHSQSPQLDRAVSRAIDRFQMCFAARDWDAVAEAFAADYYNDDRRRVVNAGIRRGREAAVEDLRVAADIGLATRLKLNVIATRGKRLILAQFRASGSDHPAIQVDVLQVIEYDADERFAAAAVFDPDDLVGAFAELDARYLAGEADAHARAWPVIVNAYAGFNEHKLPPTTADCVTIDHRPLGRTIEANDLYASIRAVWDLTPDINIYAEAVHRLSDVGAVVTHSAHGLTPGGFQAEWRMIYIFATEGRLISRCEIFDESDLDAALMRFGELPAQKPRLENAAAQVYERFWTCFEARNWDAIAETVAADIRTVDHRRVVNAGVQQGRAVEIENVRALAEVEPDVTSTVFATRGHRLALGRVRTSNRDLLHGEFGIELLNVIEINADNRISGGALFDPEDIDAAFAELDARYLAGEAAAHAEVWSEITQGYAALNSHELPVTLSNWMTIDHRVRETFAGGDLSAYARSAWDLMPDVKIRIEAVHRLGELGGVATHVAYGTSQDGFEAEWRMIVLLLVQGEGSNLCELFDEADLDAALARFDEVDRPTPGIDNAPEQIWVQLADAYNRRDTNAFLSLASAEGTFDDRRKGFYFVEKGPARLQNLRAILDISPSGWRMEVKPIAVRGSFLSLIRLRWVDIEDPNQAITVEALTIIEVTEGGLMRDTVTFDSGDIAGAVAELDARYLAGEAAPHAHTWSLVAGAFATLNARQLLATTPDCVSIDNRSGRAYEGDMIPYVNAMWELAPDIMMCIEVVHRLTSRGALVTWASYGTSQEGFTFESRGLSILMLKGDLIAHGEIFDEEHLDAALVTFEELNRGR